MAISKERGVKISNDAQTAVGDAMLAWIEQYAEKTGEQRRELVAIVGRALIMEGCIFVGNSLGMTFPPAARIARKAFEEFKIGVLARKQGLHNPEDWNE